MSDQETIGPAAIRCRDQIFTGDNHLEAYEELCRALPHVSDDELTECDGFLTNAGRYVSREEALCIAQAADQCSADTPDDCMQLRSEYIQK